MIWSFGAKWLLTGDGRRCLGNVLAHGPHLDPRKSLLFSNRMMDEWAKVSWTSKNRVGSSGNRCHLLPYEVDQDWASPCLKESLQGVRKETRAHDNGILHMRTLELVNARVSHGIT